LRPARCPSITRQPKPPFARTQKAVDSNLRGFAVGFEQAIRAGTPASPAAPSSQAVGGAFDRRLPAAGAGYRGTRDSNRLVDYQGKRYAQLYLDRLWPVLRVEEASGSTDFPLARETARYLALWMSYEDVIRVADLKTRCERRERIRSEVRAKPTDIVRVVDFLKPGLGSFAPFCQRRSVARFNRHACKRGWQPQAQCRHAYPLHRRALLNATCLFLITPAVRPPPAQQASKAQEEETPMPVERICMPALSLCCQPRLQACR